MPGDPYSAPPPANSFASNFGKAPDSLRIGVIGRLPNGPEVDPLCLDAIHRTARVLSGLGHEVEESSPEGLVDNGLGDDFMVLWCVIAAASLEGWSQANGTNRGEEDVEPATWALAERGCVITATTLVAARERLIANGRKQARWWERFDILVTPAMPQLPPRIGELTPSMEDPLDNFARQLTIAAYTAPFNSTRQPALSIPAGRSASGLPIGVQLVADQYQDGTLIRLGSQLEQARPWPTIATEPSGQQ